MWKCLLCRLSSCSAWIPFCDLRSETTCGACLLAQLQHNIRRGRERRQVRVERKERERKRRGALNICIFFHSLSSNTVSCPSITRVQVALKVGKNHFFKMKGDILGIAQSTKKETTRGHYTASISYMTLHHYIFLPTL